MKKYIAIVNSRFITPANLAFHSMKALSWKNPMAMLQKIYRHFATDSLYRNSIYLMLSTAILAFLGFFFWIINARLYTPEQVGIATTLISVMSLIAGFSNLGFNVGLIRFLPKSKNKNELINSSLIVGSVTGLIISVIFLLGLQVFSPKLVFLRESPLYIVAFILFVIALSNNIIIESVFVAYRCAKYILAKNTVLSLTKLFLPLALVAFSATGIFAAVGLANIIAMILSLFILVKVCNFAMTKQFNIHEIKKIGMYSFGNYIAGFLSMVPTMVLPIIIINKLGAEQTAYFYMCTMIANLLYTIPMATSQSLFAEGSHSETELKTLTKKALRIIFYLIIPAILITMVFGKYILLAFGKQYAAGGFSFLKILAVAGVFITLNQIGNIVLNIKHKVHYNIVLNAISGVIILGLSYLFIEQKLFGIGIAWIIGNAVTAAIYLLLIKKYL